MPTVHRYMTSNPHTVSPGDLMSTAHHLMRGYAFRHLPVVDRGKLVGIVDDRDLHLVDTRRSTDPSQVTVEEAMTRSVLSVTPETPLDEAIELMSTSRCNALVVLDKSGVAGILTATDAFWALTDLLRRTAA
jgi:acetoin utilization protein AcuB